MSMGRDLAVETLQTLLAEDDADLYSIPCIEAFRVLRRDDQSTFDWFLSRLNRDQRAVLLHRLGEQGTAGADEINLIRADEVAIEPVRWLWGGFLAAGKLHILAGSPGTGKTTIALALAATLTNSGRWPDGSRAAKSSVVIWSGEDDRADVLVPRLAAMGADLSRIAFVGDVTDMVKGTPRKVAFDPARDVEALERRIRGDPPALLIVDPIVSAVSGDSHKNAEVRRGLQPLVDLAQAHGVTVLGVTHFSKGTQGRDPTERVTGSLAFGALARIVFVAARRRDDDNTEQRVFMRSKSNISEDEGGFHYHLEQREVPGHPGVLASCVTWGSPIEGSARDVLDAAEAGGDHRSATDEATDALRSVLVHGEVSSRDVARALRAEGFSDKVIRSAREKAGVIVRRSGYGPGMKSYWSLPPTTHSCPQDPFMPSNPDRKSGHEWTDRARMEADEGSATSDAEVL